MAQSKALLRFRARLRSRGYANIKIFKTYKLNGVPALNDRGEELWTVTCVEPLMGYDAQFVCSEMEMDNWPGIMLDRNGYFSRQLDFFEEGVF